MVAIVTFPAHQRQFIKRLFIREASQRPRRRNERTKAKFLQIDRGDRKFGCYLQGRSP